MRRFGNLTQCLKIPLGNFVNLNIMNLQRIKFIFRLYTDRNIQKMLTEISCTSVKNHRQELVSNTFQFGKHFCQVNHIVFHNSMLLKKQYLFTLPHFISLYGVRQTMHTQVLCFIRIQVTLAQRDVFKPYSQLLRFFMPRSPFKATSPHKLIRLLFTEQTFQPNCFSRSHANCLPL